MVILGTTMREAAAQDVEVKSSGSSVQVGAAEGQPGKMSIRVAGFEVLWGDDNFADAENEEGYLHSHKARRIDGVKTVDKNHNRWRPRIFNSRQGMFEIGFNDFRTFTNTYSGYPASENGFMDLDIARSFHITTHVSTISQTLSHSNTFGITMALGFSYDQYFLDTPTALEKNGLMLRPYDPGHKLQKSKLRTLTFHVPLVLEWQLSRKFFVAAGGYADMLLWSDVKWKSPKEKLSSPYINFVNAGLTARVGFEEWYFFGNYALSELFKQNRGPVVSPYTFGVGIVMW